MKYKQEIGKWRCSISLISRKSKLKNEIQTKTQCISKMTKQNIMFCCLMLFLFVFKKLHEGILDLLRVRQMYARMETIFLITRNHQITMNLVSDIFPTWYNLAFFQYYRNINISKHFYVSFFLWGLKYAVNVFQCIIEYNS